MTAIILDRDGVINYDSLEYIKNPDEWIAIPGSLAAIAQLNQAGFKVFIATNQSGVARGLYDIATLHAIHAKLQHELADYGGSITDIFYCPHHPDEKCPCRKPQPGLITNIQAKHGITLQETYFIGDSHVDIMAALAVSCKPLLVLTGKGELTLTKHQALVQTIPHFPDLSAAVAYVLAGKSYA